MRRQDIVELALPISDSKRGQVSDDAIDVATERDRLSGPGPPARPARAVMMTSLRPRASRGSDATTRRMRALSFAARRTAAMCLHAPSIPKRKSGHEQASSSARWSSRSTA